MTDDTKTIHLDLTDDEENARTEADLEEEHRAKHGPEMDRKLRAALKRLGEFLAADLFPVIYRDEDVCSGCAVASTGISFLSSLLANCPAEARGLLFAEIVTSVPEVLAKLADAEENNPELKFALGKTDGNA